MNAIMDSSLYKPVLRAVWVALIIIASLLIIVYVTPLVYPFIIGWLLAYIMNPLVNWLQKKARFPRWLGSLATMILYLGLFSAIITLLVSRIVVEISRFAHYVNNNINNWIQSFVTFFESEWVQGVLDQVAHFSTQNEKLYETIEQNLINAGEKLSGEITGMITGFVEFLIGMAAGLPNFTLIIVVIVLAGFFISKDWYKLAGIVSRLFPPSIASTTLEIWNDLKRALFGYLKAQMIMISITAAFIMTGLLIMRVNYAITIGLLIGLVDLLPYLGVGAVMVPWAIYLFFQGNISLGIGISILYGIVLVTRSMIEPKVLASSIGLDALSTLIAMVVGLKLFGVVGVIIGPVTLVVLVALHKANVFRDIYHYIMHGRQART